MAEKYPESASEDGVNVRMLISRFSRSDKESAANITSQSFYSSSSCDTPMPLETTIPAASSRLQINLNKGSDTYDYLCSEDFRFHRNINIKVADDKNDCFIVAMVAVSDRDIVLVDRNNKSVKMLDVIDDVMNGDIAFASTPADLAVIPNAEIAVTFPGEKLIRLLASTSEGLVVKRNVKLNGWCIAVKYRNNKLYVSYYEPVKFQILSLSGGVKRTIKPDAQFLEHCTMPRYIAVHPDENTIYVSDYQNSVVLSMDMSGSMLAVYKDVDLQRPTDITFTPFYSIYLCNLKQHIVYKLSEDLGEASVVLAKQDRLVCPVAMCFSHTRRYLLISSASTVPKVKNFIKLYKYN